MTLVHRKPNVDIPDQTVCLDNLPLIVSAETGTNSDSYLWSTNETTSEIEITDIGSYSVTVTTINGCITTSTFNVIESEQATIEFTETIDFSNPNNITVTISGIGNYLYILDNGVPQESNFFGNVSMGLHTITVIDLNGCAQATKELVIIDTPLYVTPNGDGYNDTWHITGVVQLTGTLVYIYDRYGKLLTTLSHSSSGWDGTYRGKAMPTDDYWFLAKVVKGPSKFDIKGHFTLKR
jgi:gliding motility-associated-like protein